MSALPNPAAPRLVLAIATYKGRHLLETMLPSVAAQRFRDFRVVVVDDGSGDDTAAWLTAHWPEAQVVALERNGGVTAAFNVCVAAAGDAELVALINNDMELQPDCLGELVRALDEHPQDGFAAAKLVDYDRRDVLDGAGDLLDWAGTGWRRGHGEPDDGRYDAPGPVFGACAGAAVYRRSALDRVGPFDARFFAFCEDVDWNLRARLMGISCRYVPTAVAYHMGSATLGAGMTDFARYHITRNALWVVIKGFPAIAFVRHLPRFAYAQAATAAVAARDRQLGPYLRAWRDALRALPAMVRERRRIQRGRAISVRELEAIVQPEGVRSRRRAIAGRARR